MFAAQAPGLNGSDSRQGILHIGSIEGSFNEFDFAVKVFTRPIILPLWTLSLLVTRQELNFVPVFFYNRPALVSIPHSLRLSSLRARVLVVRSGSAAVKPE
jgi:hypothetical protein